MIVALLPASPRRRRRIVWLTAAGCILVLAIGAVFLLPAPKPIPETFSGRASVDTSGRAHLTAIERRRIDRALDRFVLAALDRSDSGTAWDLAGPDLRGTGTREDWIAGKMPIGLFPVAGRQFHGWTHVSTGPGEVSFDLLIQPRAGSGLGATAFSVQVIRRGRRWLVNRWYANATFTPIGTKHPHIVGPNDFTAPGQGNASVQRGRIGRWVVAVPVGLFALGFLVVGLALTRNWLRYRRMRSALEAERRGESSRTRAP
jgi:hypothetical protein